MPIASINPATGQTLQTFDELRPAEVEAKLQLAVTAFREHRVSSFAERGQRMRRAAEILESESDRWGRLMALEMGKTKQSAIAEAKKCAWVCRYYADHAEKYLADELLEQTPILAGLGMPEHAERDFGNAALGWRRVARENQPAHGREFRHAEDVRPHAAPRQAAAPLPVVPATAVPWTPAQPGQPTAGAPGAPPAAPVGTQTFTETQPIAPEKGGGSITYSGETPAKLDLERRRLEIQKDVDARFGDIPESKDLSHAYLVRSLANDLINQYTPEERAGYLGYVTPFLRGIFSSNDPRYAHFLDLNARLQQETGGEKSLAPSGNERTPAEYDAWVKVAKDSSYVEFAKDVPEGKQLIDDALAVK